MSELVHRRLRAPSADGTALIDPPLSQAAALIERNRAISAEFDRKEFSTDDRTRARILIVGSAALFDGIQLTGDVLKKSFIVSGHQPELFHPGVWLKNYALSAIAQSVGGLGINLAIDNDAIRTATVRVPSGSIAQPSVVEIPFDGACDAVPWECRWIREPKTFHEFHAAVRRAFQPFASAAAYKRGMIIDWLWPHALAAEKNERDALRRIVQTVEMNEQTPHLGSCLTLARHRVEKEIGLQTCEMALSLLVGDPPFLQFAIRLLTAHREFRDVYNTALAEYRHVNGIRSRSHPVPDLSQEGGWYESPFWIWTTENPLRRRVFVRQNAAKWELTDRAGITVAQPRSTAEGDELWQVLLHRGVWLRPRALVTTMYARLVLSDLFIHGIGGAKYDEVTDLIIRRFFGIEPPAYITASATFRLPIERPQVSLDDVRDSERRIREARYRPEAFVRDPLVAQEPDIAAKLAALVAEKREYLTRHDLRRCEQSVFDRLDRLNRAMHDLLAPVERELRARHAGLLVQLKHAQLLGSREFSFVLFPSEILPARLLDLCKVPS
jgi:hypothetical protein